MLHRRWLLVGVALLMSAAVVLFLARARTGNTVRRIPPEVSQALRKAAQVDLLEVHPERLSWRQGSRAQAAQALPQVGGFEVLATVRLSEVERTRLLGSLEAGIAAANPAVSASCFNPRHALRADFEGSRFEVVICFECIEVVCLQNGEQVASEHTERFPQADFDAVLARARSPR